MQGANRVTHATIVTVSYNEVGTIPLVFAELAHAIDVLNTMGVSADVILVDDHSPDGTAKVAASEAELRGFELYIDESHRQGIGAAFSRGIARAEADPRCDLIVTLDADGQHDPRAIPELVSAFMHGDTDLVIGSRWTQGGVAIGLSRRRTVASKIANRLFGLATGSRCRDATTSFRAFRPGLVNLAELKPLGPDGYTYFTSFVALAHFAGATITESPIRFRPRIAGESKLTAREGVRFARNLVRLRAHAKMATAEPRLSARH